MLPRACYQSRISLHLLQQQQILIQQQKKLHKPMGDISIHAMQHSEVDQLTSRAQLAAGSSSSRSQSAPPLFPLLRAELSIRGLVCVGLGA